jgi:hypothetical protein
MSHSRKRGRTVKFFRVAFHLGTDHYSVIPLAPDPGSGCQAFQFHKRTGNRNTYVVRVTRRGPECDCRGFRRWRRPCKHIRMLQAARMLSGPQRG